LSVFHGLTGSDYPFDIFKFHLIYAQRLFKTLLLQMRADLLLCVLMSSQCISELFITLLLTQLFMFLEKITDLSQVTDKRYHINVVSSIQHLSGIRTHNVSCDGY
jgi:hypothetical protein